MEICADCGKPIETSQAAVEAERKRCLQIAEGWLKKFGTYKPEHIGGQQWANDAVKDIADAIRNGQVAV